MLTCAECLEEFERTSRRGVPPTYCPSCKVLRRRARTNAWHKANPEKVLGHKKRAAPAVTLTCLGCEAEFSRPGRFGPLRTYCPNCAPAARLARNQKNNRRRNLARYGITPDQFASRLAAQENRCAICRTAEWGRFGPNVDHCHKTGRVRGLLCMACNHAIGQFHDDPAIIRAAALYVEGRSSID